MHIGTIHGLALSREIGTLLQHRSDTTDKQYTSSLDLKMPNRTKSCNQFYSMGQDLETMAAAITGS
jgi:hypothetical protein